MADYLTVSQFKSFNPKVDLGGISDTVLEDMITKASRRVDELTDTSFGQTTQTDEITEGTVNNDSDFVFFPKKTPIKSISALAIVKGQTEINLTLINISTITRNQDRVVIPSINLAYTGTIIFNIGVLMTSSWFFKATYVGGETAIPSSVEDATNLLVLDTLARSQNLAGATRVQQGGISISYSQRSGKSDFVKDAERLLQHHRRVSGF